MRGEAFPNFKTCKMQGEIVQEFSLPNLPSDQDKEVIFDFSMRTQTSALHLQ